MKILVVETATKNHLGMLANWEMLAADNNWELLYFVGKELQAEARTRVSIKRSKFIVSRKSLLGTIGKVDIVVLNTAQSNFLLLIVIAFLAKRLVITLHNINRWFESFSDSLKFREKFKKNILFFFVRKVLLYVFKKVMLVQCDGIILNSKNMQDYLNKNYLFSKPQVVIPFSLKQRKVQVDNVFSSPIKIVFPGQVDCSRKSYDFFLKLAEDYPKVEFVLLGRLKLNNETQRMIKYIEGCGLENVKIYREYVCQAEFDNEMESAHLLFSYVNVHYRNEIYGLSKDSGVSYLMSEYAIPLLVNEDFKNIDELNSATLYYNSNYSKLCEKVDLLISDRKLYKRLRRCVLTGRKKIGAEVVSSRVSKFVWDFV